MATVAVDFDGVIHTYDKGWQDGSIYGDWMPGAVFGLAQLMNKYAVFIHTTRDRHQVARWIEGRSGHAFECVTQPHILPWKRQFWNERGVLLVTNRKLPAVAYIDDRAIRFETWDQALSELGRHQSGTKQAEPPRTGLDAVREAIRKDRGGDPPVQFRGFA